MTTLIGYVSIQMQFIEAAPFARHRHRYLTDEEFDDLKAHLAQYPDAGDPIPGAGGMRKLRWANSQRGKGKRSGSRTIYLHVSLATTVHLMVIYDHEKQDDLSAADRKELALYARELKALAQKGKGTP